MHEHLEQDAVYIASLLEIAGQMTEMDRAQPELDQLWAEFLDKAHEAYDVPPTFEFLIGWHMASINGIEMLKELIRELPGHYAEITLCAAAIASMDELLLNHLRGMETP